MSESFFKVPPVEQPKRKSCIDSCGCWILGLVIIVLLSSVLLGPVTPSLSAARESASMQQAHQIGVCLYAYSLDHEGKYPDGKSSTEVFQKLLDEKYVTDPGIFYLQCDGKMKADPSQKVLKPENVCFDVTGGADTTSPDTLPLVFATGYKVTYAPGVAPVAVFKIFSDGLPVYYKGNNAIFLKDYTQPA